MIDAPNDDPMSAAYADDLPELARLLDKYPINDGDILWMGFLFEDYMGHLSAAGTKLLLAAGLNVNHADYGFYPLHVAIDRNADVRLELIHALLEGGADPNLHGFNDWTALHRAAIVNRNDFDVLALLLDYGADRSIATNIDNYTTAEEEARSFNFTLTADFNAAYVPQPTG